MEYVVAISAVAGCIVGAVLAVLATRVVVKRLAIGFGAPRKAVTAGALLGGGASFVPSFYLAIVVGGSLGGSWGEFVVGHSGVPIGLAIGIALALALGIALGGVAGACLAAVCHRIFKRSVHAT